MNFQLSWMFLNVPYSYKDETHYFLNSAGVSYKIFLTTLLFFQKKIVLLCSCLHSFSQNTNHVHLNFETLQIKHFVKFS